MSRLLGTEKKKSTHALHMSPVGCSSQGGGVLTHLITFFQGINFWPLVTITHNFTISFGTLKSKFQHISNRNVKQQAGITSKKTEQYGACFWEGVTREHNALLQNQNQ